MTGQDLVDGVTRFFQGISDNEALYWLKSVHTEIIRNVRLNVEDVDISLTAGTKGYAIDDDILKVWSAKYYRSAGDAYGLEATHLDTLNTENPTWPITSNMEPHEFYIEQSNIYFHPTPATTTSSSYPKVVLTVTRDITLALNTTLPGYVRRGDAWIYEACRKIADYKKDDRANEFKMMAELELKNLAATVVGRNVDFRPTIRPREIMWGGRKR